GRISNGPPCSLRLRGESVRVFSERRTEPMRYQMKQKMFSMGDDYTITDENGRPAYYVDGRAFSIGEKLSFQDMAGHELAFIKQRLLAIGPTYEIWYADELHAT